MADYNLVTRSVDGDEIGPMARLLRARRGLTLLQASSEIGVGIPSLSQAERGQKGVERLAMRSLNQHLARMAGADPISFGYVGEQFVAHGVAVDVVADVRDLKIQRRSLHLQSALVLKGLSMTVDGDTGRVEIGGSLVEIDLHEFTVRIKSASDSSDQFVGFVHNPVAGPPDAIPSNLLEVTSRFAGVLVDAYASGSVDFRVLLRELLPRPIPVPDPLPPSLLASETPGP